MEAGALRVLGVGPAQRGGWVNGENRVIFNPLGPKGSQRIRAEDDEIDSKREVWAA